VRPTRVPALSRRRHEARQRNATLGEATRRVATLRNAGLERVNPGKGRGKILRSFGLSSVPSCGTVSLKPIATSRSSTARTGAVLVGCSGIRRSRCGGGGGGT
jgi:hypothetical protein